MKHYKGIYVYKDTWNQDNIVYVGKDSRMYKHNRYHTHKWEGLASPTAFEKALQNPDFKDRWKYEEVLKLPEDTPDDELVYFEQMYYDIYEPKYNFSIPIVGGSCKGTNAGKTNPSCKLENRIKYSLKHNSLGIAFVRKRNRKGYTSYIYRTSEEGNGKQYYRERKTIEELREAVLSDGRPWYQRDENGEWREYKKDSE